jgi:hypothetical protein
MKYRTNLTVKLSIFLESVECTNCIAAQDLKLLFLLPPFYLFEKYTARQEELRKFTYVFTGLMIYID